MDLSWEFGPAGDLGWGYSCFSRLQGAFWNESLPDIYPIVERLLALRQEPGPCDLVEGPLL